MSLLANNEGPDLIWVFTIRICPQTRFLMHYPCDKCKTAVSGNTKEMLSNVKTDRRQKELTEHAHANLEQKKQIN